VSLLPAHAGRRSPQAGQPPSRPARTSLCSSRRAGTRSTRPFPLTASTASSATGCVRSPAASARPGARAGCAAAVSRVTRGGSRARPRGVLRARPRAHAPVTRPAVPRLLPSGLRAPVQTNDLCASCDGLRRRRRQSISAFVDGDEHYPPASPRATIGRCSVSACARLAGHPRSRLCPAHEMAWRAAGCPELRGSDGAPRPVRRPVRRVVAPPVADEELIAEILYASGGPREGRQVHAPTLRSVVAHLRRCGATSLAAAASAGPGAHAVRTFCSFAADRAALARATSARSTKRTIGTCACSVREGRSPLSAAAPVPAIPVSRRRVPSPSSGCARRPRRGPPRRCAR